MVFAKVIFRSLCASSISYSRRTLNYTNLKFTRCVSHSFHGTSLKSQPVGKILAIMCCFGAGGGGAYAYFASRSEEKRNKVSSSLLELTDPYVLSDAPLELVSRKVSGSANIGLHLTLFQYQSCPFCCKVRAFLDYYGVSYNVVEVNPVMKQQLKFSKYRKVPILIAQDVETGQVYQLNDSSVILSILGTFLLNAQEKLPDILKFYPTVSYLNKNGKEVTEVLNQYFLMYGKTTTADKTNEIRKEQEWRKWVDQEFVHVLSPNIYRTLAEAIQSFKYFSEVGEWERNFSTVERLTAIYVGAAAMYLIGKKLSKKYQLKSDVRESLYDHCRLWMQNLGKSQFMGGNSPNLADLSMYGLLSSIEGCEAFQDLLQNTKIGFWFYNMKKCVKQHDGQKDIIAYQS